MGSFVLAIVFVVVSSAVTSAKTTSPCGDKPSVVIQGGQEESDGSLIGEDGMRFPPGCYWNSFDNVTSGCEGKLKPCLRKCCLLDQLMNRNTKCVQSNHPLLSTFQPKPKGNFDSSKYDQIYINICKNYEVQSKNDAFVIDENGTLSTVHPEDDEIETYTAGEFCMEVYLKDDTAKVRYLACYEDVEVDLGNTRVKFLINGIGCVISIPFLLATFVTYALIPDLRNLHGKCLMSHVASLSVAFVFLAAIQLGIQSMSNEVCIASALIAYFTLLASFFWLNVMCFDIWWTFSGYRIKIGPKDPRDRQKFVYYSLYAWGAAVVFLCVCAAMQFASGIPKGYLKPNFGATSCWFDDEAARWAYFNGPVAVLIIFNITFFALTFMSLLKIKRQTAVLTEDCNKAQNEKNALRFKLYLKLFLVMGISWSLEIISSAVGGPDYIWWVTDLANVLVGIPIFIIFVWKSKVRQVFLAKLNVKLGSSSSTSGYELT